MSSDKNRKNSSSSSSSDENGPKSPQTFNVENFYRKRLRPSTLNRAPKKETNSSEKSALTDDSVKDKPYIVSGEGSTDSFEFTRKKRNVYRSPVKGNKPISLEFTNDPPSKKRKLIFAEVVKLSSSDEGERSPIRTRSSTLSTEKELSSPLSKENSKGRKKLLRKKRNMKSKAVGQTPGRQISSDENVKATMPIAQKPSGKR